MNIYVYSDESGVFDYIHNDIFVYGGLIFLDKEEKELYTRKYRNAEKIMRKNGGYPSKYKLKACKITNSEKRKLYRSTNNCIRFVYSAI